MDANDELEFFEIFKRFNFYLKYNFKRHRNNSFNFYKVQFHDFLYKSISLNQLQQLVQNHVLNKLFKKPLTLNSKEIGLILSHRDVYFNCTFHFEIVKVFLTWGCSNYLTQNQGYKLYRSVHFFCLLSILWLYKPDICLSKQKKINLHHERGVWRKISFLFLFFNI